MQLIERGGDHEETTRPVHRRGAPAAADLRGVGVAGTAPRYGWVLQLRNTVFDVRGEDMTYRQFRALATIKDGAWARTWVDDAGTPADPLDDLTYQGLTLRRLVGRIDDGDPATFNKTRAAKGYAVVVEAMDGFTCTYTSAEVMTIGSQDHRRRSRLNDAVLKVPAATLKDNGDGTFSASWKPLWPLKVVSGDADDHRQAQAGWGAAHQHRAAGAGRLRRWTGAAARATAGSCSCATPSYDVRAART